MPDPNRSLAGKIAANERWSRVTDRSAETRAARDAAERRFEDQVDPDRVLPPAERARRAKNARNAFYARLSLAGVKARKANAALAELEAEGDAA
jgi:hypothetical protein